jgi:hypothetical protein
MPEENKSGGLGLRRTEPKTCRNMGEANMFGFVEEIASKKASLTSPTEATHI